MEIKRQDGKEYPPTTLHQLVCGLQRHLRNNCGKTYVNFIKEGTQLNDFRIALDTRMKELHATGVGLKKLSSDPVTMEEELQLWETGVFNSTTATGLSNAIFYYNGKLFGFRGFQEHINCKASQFEILYDKDNKVRYIKFTPGQRKNSQGGIKNRKLVQEPILHYEQVDNEHNIVEFYDMYLSLIPRTGPLYRKPLDSVDENGNLKFSSSTISHNMIKSMLKRFFLEAGIDTEKRVTNHSARVSLCTTLYNKNFTDKAVTSRSKHRSNAVQAYQREQFEILNQVSAALEPNVKKPKTEATATCTDATSPAINKEKPDIHVPSFSETKLKSGQTATATSTDATSRNLLNEEKMNISKLGHENCITLHVPNSVTTVVVVKSDGKKITIDV